MRIPLFFVLSLAALTLVGCDAVLGSKDDDITDEIFDEGQTDPTLLDDVGYVPLFPFFEQSAAGTFERPTDVFVGYDEFIYVTDENGLHVLDLAGRPVNLVDEVAGQPLGTPGCVTQDRRLEVYVCARRDTVVADRTWNLAVVYRLSGLTTGGAPAVSAVLWHVFDDVSRVNNPGFRIPVEFEGPNPLTPDPDDRISDEDAEFTGVAVLADNSLYVTRRGPLNRQGDPPEGDGRPRTIAPFNAVLRFTPEGMNSGRLPLGTAGFVIPSLVSNVYPSDIISYFAPPQRSGLTPRRDFFIAQAPPPGADVIEPQFSVLAVNVVEDISGVRYVADADRVGAAADPERGDGFLYEPFKFERPADLARAGDETAYLFVVDEAKDSLFVFNDVGVEGVAPPPGSNQTTPAVVSFGGTGAGPLQFRGPQGVAYYERTVYVADTGNGRIARFRLNTDFE